MTLRCAQCGQENNPQYRFCGICGAPLGPPPAAVPSDQTRDRVRIPVSGPSFLGLGDERSRDLDYLLEDEPPRGRGRLYLALFLLVVSGVLLAWQWQRDGYPWWKYILKPAASNRAPVTSPPAAAPDDKGAVPPIVPAEPTATPATQEAQPTTSPAGQPAAAEPAASSAPAGASAAPEPGEQTSQPQALQPQSSEPSPAQPNDGNGSKAEKTKAAGSRQANEPEAAEPAFTPRGSHAATAARSASRKPAPETPSNSFEDRLVADGERYLYGRGVPVDCERAQRNLQIGARQSNPKAQTLLGAMYATGHCVGRDLPTAYHWFAKALQGDPGNSRVQQDLEVLWKQMTPEERQLALRIR